MAVATAPAIQTRPQIDGQLGSHISEALTWEDACAMASLDWEVIEKPLYYRFGDSYKRIDNRKGIVRADTGQIVGDVGLNYQRIQNAAAGGFLNPLVAEGDAKFLAAGTTENGSGVYTRLQLGENIMIELPDDGHTYKEEIRPELIARWRHDGGMSLQVSLVMMRLVCTNGLTLPVAVRQQSIRHSGDVEKKIATAQAIAHMWTRYRDRFQAVAQELAGKPMTWEQIQEFTVKLFPSGREAKGEEAAAVTQERRDSLLAVLKNAPDLEAIRNSKWGVYNAVAEWADHVAPYRGGVRRTAEEQRFDSIVDGSASQLKDEAYRLLRS